MKHPAFFLKYLSALILLATYLFTVSVQAAGEVVTVAGQTLYEKDIQPTAEQRENWNSGEMYEARKEIFRFSKIAAFINQTFVTDYAAQNSLQANDEFVSVFESVLNGQALTPEKRHSLAQFAALQFAVDGHLYSVKKGRVVFDQSHPMLPLEAYLMTLKEYQSAGKLTFFEQDMEALFWESFARPDAITIPPENVNFTTPWWMNAQPSANSVVEK